ncbi:MAG: LCP family protein [Clostridia bacterium]|nr:LCP family protein [Clostridia bacterium]
MLEKRKRAENLKRKKALEQIKLEKAEKKKNAAKARRQKKALNARKHPARTFWRTFCIVFVLFLVIGTPVFAFFGKVSDTNVFTKDGPVLKEELNYLIPEDSALYREFTTADRVNVLLMGVNDGLTDTLMLVSLDRARNHVDVISVPRDTYYERSGYKSQSERKINAAYRGNPVNTAKAVSEVLLGMPINYYAVIEYSGVEKIVDAMGGVPMTIPNINGKGGMYYSDPYDKPPLKIALPAGERVLNGKEAVQFLRFRKGYADADIGRVKAQQEFVKSAFRQCVSLNLVNIVKTAVKAVDSDITIGTAVGLATDAIGISGDDISTYTIPYTPEPDPPYYVYPDSKGIEDMIRSIYSGKALLDSEKPTDTAIEADPYENFDEYGQNN